MGRIRLWTRPLLLRACEALLSREDCHLRLRSISDAQTTANCSYRPSPSGPIDIVLTTDPAKGGLIESFLHEALHVVLNQHIGERFSVTLDEVLIKALQRELWVKFKKADVTRWRRLINAKLG